MSSSAIDERISGSARWPITRRAIFTVTAGAAAIVSAISRAVASSSSAGTTRDTIPWAERLLGASARRPVSTMSLTTPCPQIWYSRPDAAGVGDHAVADLGQHEPGCPRRRCGCRTAAPAGTSRRWPSRGCATMIGAGEVEELLDAPVAAGHQLVVATSSRGRCRSSRRRDPTTTTCPRPARSPPGRRAAPSARRGSRRAAGPWRRRTRCASRRCRW